MNKILLTIVAILMFGAAQAQADPVSWNFSTKKISDKVYEVHMIATLKPGWHIYSQVQPKDAIGLPTVFSFTQNPLMNFDGKVKEIGKMEKYKDATLGATNYQYSKTVNFVQKVTLKASAKTSVVGTVEYQTCDDKKCLPPKKVPFKINLG